MKLKIGSVLVASAAILFVNGSASAQTAGISDDVVKIGVLTDMSGQFQHESGEGAVTAIKMAVEDFGGKVLESRSRSSSPITRTSPTLLPPWRVNGSTWITLT